MQNKTIENFLSHSHLQMNSIMSREYYVGADVYEEPTVLTFNTPVAYPINDLLDILDDTMELVILYHVIPSDATVVGEQCCAYSDPTFDFIYKVNCITDDSGMCDTIYVTLYDSIEMLGIEVQNELKEQTSKSDEVVFARSMNDVLRNFIR